jgi:hypothetical protein
MLMLCDRLAHALQSLRNRCAITWQSLCDLFAIVLLVFGNRCATAAQPLRNSFEITSESI